VAVSDREQRLDRQRGAEEGGGGADPAAPAEVLEGVDVAAARRSATAAASKALAPRARAWAAASAAYPTHGPTARLSTTSTATGASRAAICADSTVPLTSLDRCTDTIALAPSSARR
jgi:hypothetical protein